jgi:hypothetical protein
MSRAAWPAYYGGRCGTCGGNFNKGAMVRWPDTGGGRVVHETCEGPEPAELAMSAAQLVQYREAMCLSCFTVHAPGQEGCQ